MGLGNWTQSGSGISLDSGFKAAGASSLRLAPPQFGTSSVTRTGFTNKNNRTTFFAARTPLGSSVSALGVQAANYTTLNFRSYMPAGSTWYNFRASFWYDPTTNTKWARMEEEAGGIWTLLAGDIYCGTGDPGTSSLVLLVTAYEYLSAGWFDSLVVEVG